MSITLRKIVFGFITLVCSVFFPSVYGIQESTQDSIQNVIQVSGVAVPLKATVANEVLTAQGAAVRSKFLFDVYVAALYTRSKVGQPAEALIMPGAKRMLFHFLRDIPKDKFMEAWREGFLSNNSNAVIEQNKKLINNFLDLFDIPLTKGDIMTVDYIPNIGTQLVFNGKVIGTISDEHFYRVVLSVWMGEHPPTQQFQKALLSFK